MESVVNKLIEKGLEVKSPEEVAEYLKYNTTWNMLKRSLWLKNNYIENELTGISFDEVKQLGIIEFHISQANLVLINTLEHQLKVFISRVYQELSETERETLEDKVVNHTRRNKKTYVKHINKTSFKTEEALDQFLANCSNKVYRLFELYYFKDFLKIYKFLPEYKRVCRIDPRVNDLRNVIYHHDQILKYERTRNKKRVRESNEKVLKQLTGVYDVPDQDLRIIKKHAPNNSSFVQLNLLLAIKAFLTQSTSTENMYEQVLEHYSAHINKANTLTSGMQNIQLWFTSYIKVLLIILEEGNEN
ncbi:MAG: hypothetical protein ACK5LC_02430 [Coprobacillaceae bacterium]